MRRVVCAAIRKHKSGVVICGARHFDEGMRRQLSELRDQGAWSHAEQGFIDQNGVFMTREEAFKVATEANQITRRVGGDDGKLFSENLY